MTAVPRLLSLATAVPAHCLRQEDVQRRMAGVFRQSPEEVARLAPVYVNAGVETRYSCVPIEWYEQDHGWADRHRLYLDHAVDLLTDAATRALADAGLPASAIDGLVSVSTSGIATPSLDAQLMERLPFRRDAQRLPIFGLGCGGGVIGLARAAAMARAMPDARILFLVVELCGLTFRRRDASAGNIVATALFGDGAAAAVVSCGGKDGIKIGPAGEYTWPASLDVMGWGVEEDGLRVIFSRDIPWIIRREFRAALNAFLARVGLTLADIATLICHPGGAKVLDALEDALDLPRRGLAHSRAVLRDFGNMSAVTVLFVLERVLKNGGIGRRGLLTAVGPGFTAGFLVLE